MLPHGLRIPGNRHVYDAEVESQAYDVDFYDGTRKDFVKALPALKTWFEQCFPEARSIVDLGCGSGEMISCVSETYDAWGIDFSTGAQVLGPRFLGDKFVVGDLTRPLQEQSPKLQRKFDIVFSIETYEHIQQQYEDQYLANLKSFDPDYLIVSCAPPAQKGRHHYNRLDFFDFVKKVEGAFPEMEGDFRSTITFHSLPHLRYYYRYNTVVMKRRMCG